MDLEDYAPLTPLVILYFLAAFRLSGINLYDGGTTHRPNCCIGSLVG
jgi:hypothetical protein